jgi:hypothetical protein
MKDRGRGGGAGTQHLFERGVERNRIIHAEKINAAAAEGFGITRYQLRMMLFAAKAQNAQAATTYRNNSFRMARKLVGNA